MKRILVTGGAGFIGSHLCGALLYKGWEVTVFDNLSPQIHGSGPAIRPPPGARFIQGDICCEAELEDALEGQDVVVHLAAETGTGQSMYELPRYERVNVGGTALLMDLISHQRVRSVQKVIIASSRAVYGEGAHKCLEHGVVYPRSRKFSDMAGGLFENRCPTCNRFCVSIPTDEHCPFQPSSYYGITKQAQEQTVLLMASALGISAYALRYQNVYGPGQSLKNPYTGILAVFSNLARAGLPISLFEDGLESRDFVFIQDVVDATLRCVDKPGLNVDRYNVGGGERVTVQEVAEVVVDYFQSPSAIKVSGEFRTGDVRHNIADLSYVKQELGYSPKSHFRDGVAKFLNWASLDELSDNGFSQSIEELKSRGLLTRISLK